MAKTKRGVGRGKAGATTREILDALPFQLAIVDARGIIQRVNSAWTEFALGNGGTARIAEGVGIDYLAACRTDRSPAGQRMTRGIEDVLAGKAREYACEYPCHGGGRKRWFIMRVSVLEGASRGAAIAHFLITERVVAEKALRRAKRDLEASRERAVRSEREQAEFLARMSHEIRTPLNGIVGMIESLKDTDADSDPARQAAWGSLDGLVDHLLGIVNDILDLSKVEAGKMRLEHRPFDPNGIAEDAHRILARAANAKGLDFSWTRPGDFPESVIGDGRRLRQILLNLAGNAIKFTDQGSVRITASAKPLRRGGIRLEFSVRDTGPGISARNLKKLFHRYRQVAGQPDARPAGTGLGLVISRSLAEAMGGSVTVKSRIGEGSDFKVSILVEATSGKPTAPTPAAADGQAVAADASVQGRDWSPGKSAMPDGNRGTVLIADDNEVNRSLLAAILARQGYTVLAAKDGSEALELLERAGPVSAIFLDCQMPGMDGYEAAREIRLRESRRQDARVPIVAITADVMDANIKRCRASGIDEMLGKPFRRADVAVLLERLRPREDAGDRLGHAVKPAAG